jgi:hypothetical protein
MLIITHPSNRNSLIERHSFLHMMAWGMVSFHILRR